MPYRLRTFISVDVERFTRDRLEGLQSQLAATTSGVRWTEPDNLHITLLFLGEVDVRESPRICKAVEEAVKPLAPFEFDVAGLGAFPTTRRPRILIAKIDQGADSLKAVHDAIEPAVLELGGYRREDRPFTPHVTLGRVSKDSDGDAIAGALAKFAAWTGGQTRVKEVHVMTSQLHPDGPEYTLLSRAKLQGKPNV
ncbi:MAG: RNA 2',3'-cyclic phosphodiesterase [Gemmataceae bacterium]